METHRVVSCTYSSACRSSRHACIRSRDLKMQARLPERRLKHRFSRPASLRRDPMGKSGREFDDRMIYRRDRATNAKRSLNK